MKHYTYDEWLQYVRNEITDKNREELENHLYTCDQCLEVYLQAVTANESSLPILSNETSFTDAVMAEVSKKQGVVPDTKLEEQKSNKKTPFYKQAAFHYLLAAAATILLTFTGAFQSLATYANSLETKQVQEKRPSMTEGVMNKTFAWMDSLEKKEANKK
ncbi:anti-sigma factor RsiW [Bacillus sp. SLBN-46]|uniref:anti-sigma factor family protein n=1 Tax=Bacillus sp. SLBN-46 TaxID=3042283 RepID=UPI002863C706|nr:hypothetical protein [Bacillus sp. SLBN-46]MDR6120506.1 anti-sigma factor RsiW [Bacillus sp. SLBN-46]